MKIAVLVCSNGLGHVRRVVAIVSFMLQNGFDGTIDAFMPNSHLDSLSDWPDCIYFRNHPSVKVFQFEYPKKGTGKTNDLFNKDWFSIDLPVLDKYDVVWSDNILQVLEVRPDAKITGSFFWHEVFENQNHNNLMQQFIENQKRILMKFKPKMAGNEYFATPGVLKNTQFIPVGLYRYSTFIKQKTSKSILLSCGLGGEEEDEARFAVAQIIGQNLIPPELLYVESRLLPKEYPIWIKEATFSSEMFHNCIAVCVRPGMGTISDALVTHSRIFAFCRDDSFEMIHNSNVLSELKVGELCESPIDAYKKALIFAKDEKAKENQILRTVHLRTDGVFATSNFILN
jgi:hypothetical protein